jgi:hypothetical protein
MPFNRERPAPAKCGPSPTSRRANSWESNNSAPSRQWPVVIGWIGTNGQERVRIALDSHRGVDFADVRICTPFTEATAPVPTAKGVAIDIALLPNLIAALAAAEAKARELGLIGVDR